MSPSRQLRVIGALVCTTLLLGAAPVRADEIELRSGKSIDGYLFRGERESRINTYGCSAREMTLGVVPVRSIDIQNVEPRPLRDALFRSLEELPPADVVQRTLLLKQALAGKDRPMAQRLAWELRLRDDTHKLAQKTARGDLGAFRQAHRLYVDATALRTLGEIVRLPTAEARAAACAKQAAAGWTIPAGLVERAAASFWRPRGVVKDIATRRTETYPGGRYTMYVPEDLDPLEPRPLLIALHGGGIHLVKGKTIRGAGSELMPVFADHARRMGWFVCCPTAIEAPWDASANLGWLRAVLDDVRTRWNVDENRLHLFGLGGGAAGAWMFGARGGIPWASVAAASGAAPSGVSAIMNRKAGLWLYHGDADEIFPIAPVRKVAERLHGRSDQFVYCELPKEGHGLPPAALRDWIRWVVPKRAPRAKTMWPVASFEAALSREALARWGDPAAQWQREPLSAEEALARVARGGFDAEGAAMTLAAMEADDALHAAVSKILRDDAASTEARRAAARTLGQWGGERAIAPLGDIVRRTKDLGVLAACAEGIGRVGSQDSVEDLRWALSDLGKRARALPGRRIVYASLEQIVRAAVPVVEAIGRVKAPVDLLPELEESLVIGILQDKRPVRARTDRGEDPQRLYIELASAIGRTYKACGGPGTLYDMLLLRFRKNKPAVSEILRAVRAGWPKR